MFRIIPEGLSYKEHVLLKNGQGLIFRPAVDKDVKLITSFMQRVSRESLRMRFMASISQVSSNVIEDLCKGDFISSGCLLAELNEDNKRKVVGLGNYIGMGNGRSAEVAFLIEDEYQGKGISTLLLERLAGLAAANGYIEFEAEVLPDNQPMINVFKSSGFTNHKLRHTDTVHIELPVNEPAAIWNISNLRERIAVANSLNNLLRPKTIAVIGASRVKDSIGNIIFRNILNGGFTGTIYPVNSQADSVQGVKAYSSVKELPEKIDLAVIVIPADKVKKVVEKSIKAGAKGILVVSAGFAEEGIEGEKKQKELVELVRSNGVRLLGPSCLGLINTDPNIRLNASLASKLIPKGTAGFFSHSAALGLVILDYAREKGLGFTTFISAGNRADISGNDLLQYWEEDKATKMAILYLETFGNPRRFVRIARRMSYKKPILCVKSARSKTGRKTVEAKNRIPSAGRTELEALFKQTGIILTDTLEELFDVALVLTHQPLPKGNSVAIIANSAGMTTIFADATESNGLIVESSNSVNLGAFTKPENYEKAVKEKLTDEKIDALLIGSACVGNCDINAVAKAIRKGVNSAEKETNITKPVLLCLMGEVGLISLVKEDGNDERRMFPAFRFPETATRALGKIVKYAEFIKRPAGILVWDKEIDSELARKIIQDILKKNSKKDKIIDINKNDLIKIFNTFGFNFYDKEDEIEKQISINVKPDKLFGPLIEIQLPDKTKFVRITPLTDRDIEETITEICETKRNALKLIFGKLSQMIEEIPWLWELEMYLDFYSMQIIKNNLNMNIKPGGAKRPVY